MIHFQENLKNKNAFYKRIITLQNKYKMRHGVIYIVIHSSLWQLHCMICIPNYGVQIKQIQAYLTR
jgi:hypothetical protein